MKNPLRARGRTSRKVAVTLAAGLAVTLSLLAPASVSADEGHEGAAGVSDPADDPSCTPAEERRLRAMADRFAAGCTELGSSYGAMDDSEAENTQPERIASRNMSLVAQRPKTAEFANSTFSDLAFKGKYAFSGTYDGFTVFDISKPRNPRAVTRLVCPGGQGDPSVYGDVLVFSVDARMTSDECGAPAHVTPPGTEPFGDYWEGLRVFDISDPANPEYVASVETDCGSHTNSLAPSKNGQNLFVYVSSYSPNARLAKCQPPHDRISVVKIPMDAPETAKVVSKPLLFPTGGNPGSNGSGGGFPYSATSGCHDITTYVEKDIAAGACMGDGILMDIKNRYQPKVTEVVRDTDNFAFWHSATFNNAGTKVVFTDELGGGGAATCNPDVGPKRGANGIYDINRKGDLVFRSYFKIPRTQTNTENCVAHNGSLIPVKGRDIMVQAWYMGGISVFEFTDSKKPREIAWFDRGPTDNDNESGGNWSSYWHNGYVYSNDIGKGFNVLDISARAVQEAKKVRLGTNNPQAQKSYRGR